MLSKKTNMKHFKKILAALIIIFFAGFLISCGESSTSTTTTLKAYQGNGFTIKIDPKWKIINKSDFYAEIPQETVMAFTAPEAYNGFFINVNIVREDLKQKFTSVDYGRANINMSAQNLTSYKKVQEVKMTVGGESALLHIFEARLNASEKLIRFIQLYVTSGNYGYIVSGGMLPDTPQTTRDLVGAMVTSFGVTSSNTSSSS